MLVPAGLVLQLEKSGVSYLYELYIGRASKKDMAR